MNSPYHRGMGIAKILAMIMIVSVMLGAGLQVDLSRVKETLRDYGLLARALLANFVLVPLFAVILVRALHIQADVATGIVLMSMAPGVPFIVNTAGRKQGGSLSLVLTIAFCFTALSVITIPLTLPLALPDIGAQVPVFKFLTTLILFQLLPLIIGAVVSQRMSEANSEKAAKVLQFVFIGVALVLVVVAFDRIVAVVSSIAGGGQLLTIAAVGVFSLAAGWLMGGRRREYRRTLSIATLMRNIGLCALIGANDAFTGTLVLPTILTYFVVTFVLSLPFVVFYARTKEIPA